VFEYVITLTVLDNPAVNVTVADALPPGVAFQSFVEGTPAGDVSGGTITWWFPTLAPGVTTLAYHVRVDDFLANGTVLTNRAAVTHAAHPAPVEATASTTVQGDFEVRIGVYNQAGELVKEILVSRFSQPLDSVEVLADTVIGTLGDVVDLYFRGVRVGSWDGTDAAGQPVRNGEYVIKVDNIDAFGVVDSLTQDVVVNRALSRVSVTVFDSAGEAVRHLHADVADLRDLVTGVQLSSGVLHPGEGAPDPGEVREVGIVLSNGTGLTWDGRDDGGSFVPGGEYYVEVRSTDGSGGEQVVVREIAVMGDPGGEAGVVAAPNVLRGYGSRTLFTTVPASGAALRVRVYATSGELVASMEGPSGDLSWAPGYYAASGLYLAVVESRYPDGRMGSRKVLKILLIR
jgi:hypothetical protein